MAQQLPNGVNKFDSNDYVRLQYYNENWETIDAAIGDLRQADADAHKTISDVVVPEMKDADSVALTLKHGTQIVNVKRGTPMRLRQFVGRTLVNLLGRAGSFASGKWKIFAATGSESGNVYTMKGDGTAVNPQLISENRLGAVPSVGDKVFLRAKVCNVSGTPRDIRMYLYDLVSRVKSSEARIASPVVGEWYDIGIVVTIPQEFVTNWSATSVRLVSTYADAPSSNGAVTKFRGAAVYKIPASDAALPVSTLLQKYPYVEGVSNVDRPYVEVVSDNLIPPFTSDKWVKDSWFRVQDGYRATCHNSTGEVRVLATCTVAAKPLTTYTFGGTFTQGGAYLDIVGYDAMGGVTLDSPNAGGTTQDGNPITVQTTADTTHIQFRIVTTGKGEHEWRGVWAVVGHEAKPFKPQQRSLWAVECELAAEPLAGSDADTLVVGGDGKPYMIEKWEKITLDGSYTYATNGVAATYRTISFSADTQIPKGVSVPHGTKYDGTVLRQWQANIDTGDFLWFQGTFQNFYLTVSHNDTGWGATYNPTADEVKAYFLGWKMTHSNGATPYTTTGAAANGGKVWIPLRGFNGSNGSPTLPHSASEIAIANGWTPYRLQYLKETTTVVPVKSYEIGAALTEGDNVVTVGTKLATSTPSPSIVFEYEKTLGAVTARTTQDVAELAARVSVMEGKKADKPEAVQWIAPTLLNGWQNFGSGFNPAGYNKTSDGMVHLRGMLKLGTVGYVAAFMLPPKYRPSRKVTVPILTYGTAWVVGGVEISPTGNVQIIAGGNVNVTLDGISFLAE